MNSRLIGGLLRGTEKQRYRGKVGELLHIELPRIPLTRDTEFLQLKIETVGDVIEEPVGREQEMVEGLALPSQILRRGVKPGTSKIIVRAYDALTDSEIAGIEPLEITVDIDGD